jgi:uncharacterized membrane protein (DUF106 family)
MEMRCKKVLDDLLINQEKLTKTERVNLFNDSFPKAKSVRDKFILAKIKREKRSSL